MNKTILVLGGGWGGLTAAHALKGMLPQNHRIVVIEKRQSFVYYPSFLKVMIGEKKDLSNIENPYKTLLRKDLEIINEEVIGIDPINKTVVTNLQSISADFIIIAMGAELYPESIPGFNQYCTNLYDTKGAFDAYNKINDFKKGSVAVLVTRAPFRCPPAPYEAAFLMNWFYKNKGIRDNIKISVYSPEKFPMPSAGPQVGEKLAQMLKDNNIYFYPEHSVKSIAANTISFSNNTNATFDMLIGIPPHGAPKAIVDSKLANPNGYIPAHPQTMEILDSIDELSTKYPGVYALGDAAGIRLLNGAFLPKAGMFAEEEAHVVARNIAAQIKGEKATAQFNGKGICYVDVGDNKATEGSGDFYAYPAPIVNLDMPSIEGRIAKHEFERILETWFDQKH